MKNALILHGTSANHTANWFEWLGKELEGEGYKVWVPDLPQSERPNIERYNSFIFSNKNWEFNQDSIIIGHSSGAVAALGLLESLPENIRICHTYLVSAFIDDLNWDALTELFIKPFNFEKIKTKSNKFTLIHSDDDPYCPLWHAETLAKKLNGNLIIEKGQGHFNTEKSIEYRRFPFLLDTIHNN